MTGKNSTKAGYGHWTGQDRASADRSEHGGSSLCRISRAGPIQDNDGVRAKEA